MKSIIYMAAAGLLLGSFAQPVFAQRPGGPFPAERGTRGNLLIEIARDFDRFAETTQLSDVQRADVRRLIDGLDSEDREALQRISVLRDSLPAVRRPRRGMAGDSLRALVREYQELQRTLMPAAMAFRADLADILTWNQGERVKREYRPSGPQRMSPARRGMRTPRGPRIRR